MPKQPPRRAASDTLRLKRDIARNDSTYRALRSDAVRASNAGAKVLGPAAEHAFKTASAKQDTLNRIRKGAPMPSAGHKSFAKNTEGFDGASLSDRPPRMEIPRGNPTPDAIPSAHGTPALAQRADGTANLRATAVTRQAEVRSAPSGKRGPSLPQSFNDGTV